MPPLSFKEKIEIARIFGLQRLHSHILKNDFESWNVEGAYPKGDILADHVIACNSWGEDEGEYRPELIGANQDYTDYSDGKRFYLQDLRDEKTFPNMSIDNALYVSRRNSGNIPGSTGFIDHVLNPQHLDDDIPPILEWEDRDNIHGFTAHLNPDTNHIIGSIDDWIDFMKKYGVEREYHLQDSSTPEELDRYGNYPERGVKWRANLDWDRIKDDRIYSLEFPKTIFNELGLYDEKQSDALTKLYNERISFPFSFMGEPQIVVIHPDAVTRTEPYKWMDNVVQNSKGYRSLEDFHSDPDSQGKASKKRSIYELPYSHKQLGVDRSADLDYDKLLTRLGEKRRDAIIKLRRMALEGADAESLRQQDELIKTLYNLENALFTKRNKNRKPPRYVNRG